MLLPQEYLEDVDYLADDEMYSDFYMPFAWRNKIKLGMTSISVVALNVVFKAYTLIYCIM